MIAAVGAAAAPGCDPDPVAQVIMHPLGRSVGLPLIRPPVDGARGREIRRQRPPHRAVVGEVADGVDDVAHAPAGRAAAAPGQPRRGRQQRLADRPFRPGHVRGIAAGAGAAGDPARAAPARHRAGGRGWLDIMIGGRVERHEGSWHRAGFDTQAITRGLLRHISDTPDPAPEDPDLSRPTAGRFSSRLLACYLTS